MYMFTEIFKLGKHVGTGLGVCCKHILAQIYSLLYKTSSYCTVFYFSDLLNPVQKDIVGRAFRRPALFFLLVHLWCKQLGVDPVSKMCQNLDRLIYIQNRFNTKLILPSGQLKIWLPNGQPAFRDKSDRTFLWAFGAPVRFVQLPKLTAWYHLSLRVFESKSPWVVSH